MEEAVRTLSFVTADTAKSATIMEAEGIVLGYTLVLPQTSAASGILTIKDTDGYTVYTGDSKNDNQTVTVVSMTGLAPIGYGYTITITPNAQAGGAHDCVVKLYIAKR